MIKVTIGELKPQEKPFPKLMISNDGARIVLFISDNCGVQIDGSKAVCDKFPHYSDNWLMKLFTDYIRRISRFSHFI